MPLPTQSTVRSAVRRVTEPKLHLGMDVRDLANSAGRLQAWCWALTVVALLLVAIGFGIAHQIISQLQPNLGAICAREILDSPLCP